MRLAHEREMKQMELEAERERWAAEAAQREHEPAQREQQERLESERLATERERLAAEVAQRDLRKAELLQQERLETERLANEKEKLLRETGLKTAELDIKEKAQNDEMKLIKRYGDALAQVLSSQPEEVTDLPAYFRSVEEQFEKLKIPTKFRARLIYKYLSARARAFCSRLEPTVRDD